MSAVSGGARESVGHTFLFEPAVWSVGGTFWAGDRRPIEAQGRIEITHRDTCWLLAGSMKVLSSPHIEFVSAYSIELPGRDPTTLKWKAENAMLGKLLGVFSVVGDSILSIFHSTDGSYQGTEYLEQVDAGHYRASAMLLFNDRKLSSWQVTLTRSGLATLRKALQAEAGSSYRALRRRSGRWAPPPQPLRNTSRMATKGTWLLGISLSVAASAACLAQGAGERATLPMTTAAAGARPGIGAEVVKVLNNCDAAGPLHIIYSDGADVLQSPPRAKAPATDDAFAPLRGFSDAQVAADRQTVGWTEKYSACCQSYPIALVLTVYRSGKIMLRLQQGQMLHGWMFVDGGKQVAVKWGTTHGADIGDFLLYDVDTGRVVAEAWGDKGLQKLKRDAPPWARQLETAIAAAASLNPPCTK